MWVKSLIYRPPTVCKCDLKLTCQWGENSANVVRVVNVVLEQTQTHTSSCGRVFITENCLEPDVESITGCNLTSVRVGVSIETKHRIHTVCLRDLWALNWTDYLSCRWEVLKQQKSLTVCYFLPCLCQNTERPIIRAKLQLINRESGDMWEVIVHNWFPAWLYMCGNRCVMPILIMKSPDFPVFWACCFLPVIHLQGCYITLHTVALLLAPQRSRLNVLWKHSYRLQWLQEHLFQCLF